MAFIPAVNTAQVRMQFDYQGQQCENVYYVENQAAWDAAALFLLAAVFGEWWIGELAPDMPLALTLTRILCRDMTTSSSPGIEYTTDLPHSGEQSVEALPNHVTVAVKWITGLIGRSFRGRTYHLGLADAGVAANAITPTLHGILNAAYNQLRSNVSTADVDWRMVVASFYSGVDVNGDPIPRATAVLTPILNAVIDLIVDSQRRRLPGRGA